MGSKQFDLRGLFASGVRASISAKSALLEQVDEHVVIIQKLAEILRGGGQILLFGNGGSAADAQHIATELVGRFYHNRPALAALPLSVNSSALTAIGNDFAFREVFARQVEAYGRPGDAAVGISTSGNAENVLAGIRAARRAGLLTVGLTGLSGGKLAAEVDVAVRVASQETARIQEVHILVGHLWCQGIEQLLFGSPAEA